jgi:glycine hydroxymethyltransferase
MENYFKLNLEKADHEVNVAIEKELDRENSQIELIASENFVSKAVLEAAGSILTNKYAEGYPGKRYYGGCEFVDEIERLAIERACKLFGCKFANVQAHSGSQANQAVYLAYAKPGDYILGMSLSAGGHLTHGAAPNLSGKWFNAISYGVRREDGLIDFKEVEDQAMQYKPKLIIAGGSAYPRVIDFARFREIADKCGAMLWVDMAHIAGLVATGEHPNVFPHAHVVTSTTHKTLRGPRGGLILTNEEDIAKKINSAIFPGIQGGPLMHIIAAKAVAFGEALKPEYKSYIKQVKLNASALANRLIEKGFKVVTDGTDNHLLLVDLRVKNCKGNVAEAALEKVGLTCNKNAIAFDDEKPTITSGIRLGSPACTTRGFKEAEFILIADLISEVIDNLDESGNLPVEIQQKVRAEVQKLCNDYPLY